MCRAVSTAVAFALLVAVPSVGASSLVPEVSVGPVLSESAGSDAVSPTSVMVQGRWLDPVTDAVSTSVLVRYRNEPYGALWRPFSPDHGGITSRNRADASVTQRTHFLEFGFGLSAFRPGAGVTPFADFEVGGALLRNNDETSSPFFAIRFGVTRRLGGLAQALLSAGMRGYPSADHTAAEISLGLAFGCPAGGSSAPAAN